MMKWRYYIGLGMAAVLGWGMVACSDSVPSAAAEEKPVVEGKYYLNLTLRMADIAGSRAADPDFPSTPGADSENHISSLHVFFADDKGGEWKVLPLNVNLSGDDESEIRIPLEEGPLPEGITMYLGANLNEEQVKAFMENKAFAPSSDTDVTIGLAPYSIGYKKFPEARQDVAMFCTKSVQPQKVEGKYNVYTVNFSLKRLVAKVLLTCEQATGVPGGESGIVYAPVKDDAGWVRQDSIWFLLNARNRSSYIMQRLNEGMGGDKDANVEDPNPELTEYLESKDAETYWEKVRENFIYLDRENFNTSGYFRPVLAYDGKRMNESSDNPYTEGIYCPENSFFANNLTPAHEATLTAYNNTGWGMITHVAIMVKFTPRLLQIEYGLFDYVAGINTEEYPQFTQEIKKAIADLHPSDANNPSDEDVFEVTCGTEAVAHALLTASLMKAGRLITETEQEKRFPRETFFHHADYAGKLSYYTYGAACIKYDGFNPDDPTVLGNYVPHLRGWGYHFTYIDNRAEDKKNGNEFIFYRHGQVERNRYYILRITSFSGPGSSIENPDYIEVNTVKKDWIYGGKGEITLN